MRKLSNIYFVKVVIVLSCTIALLFSCSKDSPLPSVDKLRTIIIYMIADNDLYYNAETDIAEILEARYDTMHNNILTYVHGKENSLLEEPTLYKVVNGELLSLQVYVIDNSTSPDVLRSALLDAKRLSPSKEYGLILWSHATGWLPPDLSPDIFKSSRANRLGLVKSFGRQQQKEMDIMDLSNSIPYKMDFIIFDACLMASIECLYELKDKSEIIVASPTDILAYGFPYEDIIPSLCAESIDYNLIVEQYMNFYNNKSGLLRSGTISVINMYKIEKLAVTLRQKVDRQKIPFENLAALPPIQRFDSLEKGIFFDFGDMYRKALGEASFKELEDILKEVILFKDNTDRFLYVDIITNSGVSTYIPQSNSTLTDYYKKLAWYKAIFD